MQYLSSAREYGRVIAKIQSVMFQSCFSDTGHIEINWDDACASDNVWAIRFGP